MKRLGDREQRYAYLGSGFAAAVSVALWAPSFDERAAVALSGIGLIMAALLALAAKRRNRLFTGLAAVLLAFGPWGMAWVLGLPFLVLAAWLALRSPRLQPRMAPELDEHGEIVAPPPREQRPPKASRRRRESGGGENGEGGGTLAAGSGAPAPRKAPTPSKRYTPPQRRT